MAVTSTQFTPITQEGANTPFGVHYIMGWWACPQKWFLSHALPTTEGRGVTPRTTDKNLLLGSLYHIGMEVYRHSRWRDGEDTGEPVIDAAMDAIGAWASQRADEFEDAEQRAGLVDEARTYVRRYYDWFGPRGTHPEYPSVKLLADPRDPSKAAVEIPLSLDLGYRGYTLTGKLDALVTERGFVWVDELKTTSIGPNEFGRSWTLHPQPATELLLSRENLGVHVHGIRLNAVYKKWSANQRPKPGQQPKPQFFIEHISRSQPQLDLVRHQVLTTLIEIDEHLNRWQAMVAEGSDPYAAGLEVFTMKGTGNGTCRAYNRDCEFAGLCQNFEHAPGMLLNFKSKRQAPVLDTALDID